MRMQRRGDSIYAEIRIDDADFLVASRGGRRRDEEGIPWVAVSG